VRNRRPSNNATGTEAAHHVANSVVAIMLREYPGVAKIKPLDDLKIRV
jgi:hypothetical protein